MSNKIKIKIQIISNHTKYKKDQIVEMEEKEAIPLLTIGKVVRARKIPQAPKENKSDKKLKKNDI